MGLLPPCLFDWARLASGPLLKPGGPCDYEINDGDEVQCVGSWTASKFKDFWCEQYEQIQDDRKWIAKKNASPSDIEGRAARRVLAKQVVDSVGAWNQMNGYLLGFLVASLVFSVVSVLLDLKFRKDADEAKESDNAPKA